MKLYFIDFGVKPSTKGGYNALVFVNGTCPHVADWCNRKTARGALNAAKRMAENHARELILLGNATYVNKWDHSII